MRLKAPSEPKYVLRGVNVSVGNITARTAMHPIRQRLFDFWKRTTPVTRLRGVLRVNRYNSYPSFFRFGYEDIYELCPTSVVCRLCKPGPSNAFDVKSFVSYQPVGVNQLAGCFVVEVSALVGNLLLQAGHALSSLASPVRASYTSREHPGSPSKPLLGLLVVSGSLYRVGATGDEEALESQIYPDLSAAPADFGSVADITDKNCIPLTALALDRDGFDGSLKRVMQLDLDMPDMLEIQPPVVFELASIAVGGELYGIEAVPPLEARVAYSFTRLNTPEECFEGTVQPSQGRLRAREVGSRKERVRFSRFFELPRLRAIGDGAEFGLVRIPALFQGSVIQPAVRLKHCAESFRLRAGWIKPVLECLFNYPLRVS